MNEDLDAALSARPWSMIGLVNGFESFVDEERRPLFERRAPVGIREGVPMVVKACPYQDERYGRAMNISALEQIIAYLPDSESDIASFRKLLPQGPPSWPRFSLAVMDQMAQPAVYSLLNQNRSGPVPTRMAVGFKVAVGYSKPTWDLLELDLIGQGREPTIDTLIEIVHERRFFVGAREVCAGPTNMVVRVAEALMRGEDENAAPANPMRLTIAEALTMQLQLGIAWRIFDRYVERRMLLQDLGRSRLHPRTPYLVRTLDERFAEYDQASQPFAGDGRASIPGLSVLPSELRAPIEAAIEITEGKRPHNAAMVNLFEALLGDEEGAMKLLDRTLDHVLAHRFAELMAGYRAFATAHCALELRIRESLGWQGNEGIRLDSSIFPRSRTLNWFELMLGYRLRYGDNPLDDLKLRCMNRTVPLPAWS